MFNKYPTQLCGFSGTPPRLLRLFLYTLIPILSSLIYGYCSLSGMSLFEKPHEQVNKKKKNVDSIFGLTMLINYFIIAYCSIRIRRTLRAGPITSATTRRMNRDMDRALIPIFSNVFPSSYMHYAISKCDDYPWLGLIDTCMINSLFIFSPISIIHFVRPYRRTAQKWFRLIGSRRLTVAETSGSVTGLTQRHVKGRPIFYVRKLSITPITL
ncbi:hypothetical protein M3Y96_00990500 [Aphelenchoides besseyi]|nr:hypothetical protein M3Y96_00990500 [Aphelenchoides besseyi]